MVNLCVKRLGKDVLIFSRSTAEEKFDEVEKNKKRNGTVLGCSLWKSRNVGFYFVRWLVDIFYFLLIFCFRNDLSDVDVKFQLSMLKIG